MKPVSRICKYPLLLQYLQKDCPKTHKYYDELVQAVESSKRVADKACAACARAENIATVELLSKRVQDWKGHNVYNFGELLLDDVFKVTKSGVERVYHVFLFEKILLCCKDYVEVAKTTQGNSILLKKHALESVRFDPSARKKTSPLLLKGRIYLKNITTVNVSSQGECQCHNAMTLLIAP